MVKTAPSASSSTGAYLFSPGLRLRDPQEMSLGAPSGPCWMRAKQMPAALALVRMTERRDGSKCLTMVADVRRFLRALNSSSCSGVQTQETFLRSRTRSLVLAAARSGRYVPSWGGLHCVYIFKSYIVTTEFPTKN